MCYLHPVLRLLYRWSSTVTRKEQSKNEVRERPSRECTDAPMHGSAVAPWRGVKQRIHRAVFNLMGRERDAGEHKNHSCRGPRGEKLARRGLHELFRSLTARFRSR